MCVGPFDGIRAIDAFTPDGFAKANDASLQDHLAPHKCRGVQIEGE